MAVKYKHPAGTLAALNTLAGAAGLISGQIYYITDQSRIAIATSTSAYTTFAKQSEAGGSAGGGMAWTPVTATGTGASQGVTIPESGLSASAILVFVNGVLQIPTTNYTVSGTTVTLTTESSGDEIQIVKPGGASWGSIAGTLSDQTDLQSALTAKQASNANLTSISAIDPTSSAGQFIKVNVTADGFELGSAPVPSYITDGTSSSVSIDAGGVGVSGTTGQWYYLPNTLGTNGQLLGITNASTNSTGWVDAPSGATWGGITGTLSSQTDLSTALAAKAPTASPTFTGKVTTAASASGGAGFRITPGGAPTTPVDGDMWTDSNGLHARISGSNATMMTSLGGTFSNAGGGNSNSIILNPNNGYIYFNDSLTDLYVGLVSGLGYGIGTDFGVTAGIQASGGGSVVLKSVNGATTGTLTLTSTGASIDKPLAVTGNITGSNLSGTNTGDQTITLTGDVTGSGTGSFATSIGSNKVTRGMLAAASAASIMGATAAGNVADLTPSQAKTVLAIAAGDVSGLAATATSTSAANLTGTLPSTVLPVQGFTLGVSSTPAASQRMPATAPYAFTVTATNSKATALVAATASTVFTLYKGTVASPTTIGTFTFAASGTTATVSITAGSVSAGDTVWIQAPSTADTTLADITFLIRA